MFIKFIKNNSDRYHKLQKYANKIKAVESLSVTSQPLTLIQLVSLQFESKMKINKDSATRNKCS